MGPLRHLHLETGVLTERRRPLPVPARYRDLAARAIPFTLFMLVLALGPAVRGVLPDAVDARWLYAVQIALPLAALAYLWPEYGELRAGPAPTVLGGWILGAVVGALVFLIWVRLDFRPWVMGTSEGFDPRDSSGRVLAGLAGVRLLGAALVVPLMEELFWRSFIMRWLAKPSFLKVDPRTVGAVPILVSSALFATEHHLWLAGLLAGLAYAWLYRRTGSLWVAVFAHAVTNGLLGVWVLSTGSWTFW